MRVVSLGWADQERDLGAAEDDRFTKPGLSS
jgi:hypothetical protein